MREVVFDTETTGLDARGGDRVIEIGAIELEDGFPTGRTYHTYLNPEGRAVHPDALAVHGISNDALADKPTFQQEADGFDAFFGNGRLIAHNASFDVGFLNAELERAGRNPISDDRVIDTLAIARQRFPGARHTLDALCSRFDVDASRRDLHGALIDAELLAQVYLELTGGRQKGLALDAQVEAEAREDSGSSRGDTFQPQRVRDTPLPPRLTKTEQAAHRAFIDELGPDALWLKVWGEDSPGERAG